MSLDQVTCAHMCICVFACTHPCSSISVSGRYQPCRHSRVVCLSLWSSEVADKAVMGEAVCGACGASPGLCVRTWPTDVHRSAGPDYGVIEG